jgi:hypothetical protein
VAVYDIIRTGHPDFNAFWHVRTSQSSFNSSSTLRIKLKQYIDEIAFQPIPQVFLPAEHSILLEEWIDETTQDGLVIQRMAIRPGVPSILMRPTTIPILFCNDMWKIFIGEIDNLLDAKLRQKEWDNSSNITRLNDKIDELQGELTISKANELQATERAQLINPTKGGSAPLNPPESYCSNSTVMQVSARPDIRSACSFANTATAPGSHWWSLNRSLWFAVAIVGWIYKRFSVLHAISLFREWLLTRWSVDLLMWLSEAIGASIRAYFSALHIVIQSYKRGNWPSGLWTYESDSLKIIGVSTWEQFSVLLIVTLFWGWMTDQMECGCTKTFLQNKWDLRLEAILCPPY